MSFFNNEHLKLREEYISEIERENERLKEQNKRQNEVINSLREMYAKEVKSLIEAGERLSNEGPTGRNVLAWELAKDPQ